MRAGGEIRWPNGEGAFDQIDNAPEERRARHHHRHGSRGVRDRQAALRARRLPRSRRLREEHDHRRGPDGRCDPGGERGRRPDAADPRAHPAGPPGRRALHRRLPQQVPTWSTTRSCWSSSSWRCASCSTVRLPGRRHPDHPSAPRSRRWRTEATRTTRWARARSSCWRRSTSYIPEPERDIDKPFLMPIEDVFSIKGRGTVVTGRVERGVSRWATRSRSSASKRRSRPSCTGVEMFRKTAGPGQAGDNVGVLLRGVEKEDVERGQVLCKPGSITPHT